MKRRVALAAALSLAAGAGVPAALAVTAAEAKPAVYLVGGAWKSINPPDSMLANNDFYLGGFGFGSGKIANQVQVPDPSGSGLFDGRYATGILGDPQADPEGAGAHSRALAVSDGKSATIVLAQIETQGYFDAYKQGPFGLNEIRKDAATEIARDAKPGDPPAPTASQIVVDSDHSHSGPDTVGVWGGVPTAYLAFVHDQTVQAIVDAYDAMRPATLTYGISHAGVATEAAYLPTPGPGGSQDWLLHNQFNYDPNNQTMDDEVRVLQARDPESGKVLDTYVNFGAHPDVLGSSNRLISGDYPTRVNVLLEKAYGGFGMDQVSTLGREQPERGGCSKPTNDPQHDNVCALDEYAARVVTKVKAALAKARPLTGTPTVAMNSYLLSDTTTSGVLAGVTYAGTVIGVPAARAANAPWYTATHIGTTYYVGRIGPILITGGPGEMYAQIWQRVKDTVLGDKSSGITSVMNVGTAGDFLGYIIAPLEAYPEPAYASIANHDTNCHGVPDPVGEGCPDPVGNDNYFFNVSHTFGERLTCDFLRGAGDILASDAQKYWSTYDRCPAFVNDLVAPPGLDAQFPEQPDLSSVLTHL